ncbi:aspartate/glutamate racemase family protein [Xylophilus sp.]|uniref:aspartate/glutamate racemase family protein n=1 Tax=Xylophilus sp. TaxID=2653893 RepID=UPI0013BDEDCE|nr:amino acid racemase [Xylophilus sp.]KAF1045349.1 MAG: Aspartate racemase [Xylophilus sp.]
MNTTASSLPRRVGVFGGMGPLATVDFMDKVVQLTPAARDQEHLPVIVASLPHIPDRSTAIVGGGADPLPALLAGIDVLNTIGVGVVAVTCNSAHHWYAQMAERSHAPVIHIAHACVAAVPRVPQARVAVLATRGALASGFYQDALRAQGIDHFVPGAATGQDDVDACIRAVKAGDLAAGTAALDRALAALAGAGATAVIMGCTEIPIAARGAAPTPLALIDSTLELARATVAYALERGWNRP